MSFKQKLITNTTHYDYLLFLPITYQEQKSFPLIIFLHGAGERGSDLNWVKRQGVAKIVEEKPDFPFIVISPQCPQGEYWSVSRLSALLDEIVNTYPVDHSRIYLTGLSMGGYGTWHWAIAQPHRFAAIAPICGGGIPQQADRLKNTPVWAFHGARDRVVPLSESQKMVEALKACQGNVKFTVYPEAAHDSWTETYNNQALYEWFLWHRQTLAAS